MFPGQCDALEPMRATMIRNSNASRRISKNTAQKTKKTKTQWSPAVAPDHCVSRGLWISVGVFLFVQIRVRTAFSHYHQRFQRAKLPQKHMPTAPWALRHKDIWEQTALGTSTPPVPGMGSAQMAGLWGKMWVFCTTRPPTNGQTAHMTYVPRAM